MDHLPLPKRAEPPKIDVPFVCHNVPESSKQFMVYAPEHGLALDQDGIIDVRALFSQPYDDQLSFVQSWLYFAPLRLVCGSNLKLDEFQKQSSDGHTILNSSSLPSCCQRIHKWLLEENHDEDILECLRIAHRNFAVINQDNEHTRTTSFSAILMSIRVLYDYIWNSDMYYTPPQNLVSHKIPSTSLQNPLPSTLILRRYMKDRGWCIHDINNLESYLPVDTLYYFSTLPRSKSRTTGHENCASFSKCNAYNFGDEMSSGHVRKGCGCYHLKPSNPEALHKIIERGGIPLVTFHQKHRGDITLQYIEAQPSSSYVAVSHLWADGLGNQHANSMPHCQLSRMMRRVKGLQGPLQSQARQNPWNQAQRMTRRGWQKIEQTVMTPTIVCWVDVFCIPVPIDPKSIELKSKAIGRMSPTYASADWVLVLDGELQETSSTVSYEEMLSRLLISSWNSRYWCTQEFSLARRQAIQFEDGPLEWIDMKTSKRALQVNNNVNKFQISPRDRLFSSLLHIMPVFIPSAVGVYAEYEELDESRCIQFATVWNNLLGRTSSKAKDLHCVMANLLDYSAKEVLDLPPLERTKAIIRSHNTLPLDILFCIIPDISNPDAELSRDIDGYRWISQLPTGSPLHPIHSGSNAITYVTDKGLLLKAELFTDSILRCFEINFQEVWRPLHFTIQVEGRQWWVELRCSPDDPGPKSHEGRPFLLLQTPLKTPRVAGRGYLGYGALVYSVETLLGTQFMVYDCPITYGLLKGVCTDPHFANAPTATVLSELTSHHVLITSSKPLPPPSTTYPD